MRPLLIIIFSLILLVYGGLTYYIGIRGWQFVVASGLDFSTKGYWLVLWVIAFSFFFARGADKWIPSWLSHPLEIVGAYWLGVMTYLTMILFIVDMVLLLNNRLQLIPDGVTNQPTFTVAIGSAILILILAITVYGGWNARNPQIIEYEVQLDKEVNELEELNVVMLSDLHLGRLVGRRQLEKMIKEINHLNPDLVLMPGDIIDDRVDPFVEQNMMEVFQRLNPPLGVYGSMGNHENIGGQVERVEKYFQQAGIRILRDEYVKIKDQFYIVGREDKSFERFKGSPRQELKELLMDVDKELPIIMLDHQPVGIDEAIANGVDIQLSGHTHRGQLFPFRMFTKKIFMVDWGYKRIEDLHLIVSSGVGTWGPPIRVGSRSEILHIKVKFE
ncbi:metallophosphoesterase [Alkaliphilus metalliredigens QYMF]|uniref:Metallophosphoesterase n=1 Tax=Alkaliphilus metalliredigens (strain QYMF) TaxID=293826 RepID=A6TNV3_ALKMQ|nr:metallophosphoesterase [Alkaliphilus metalliredigens]ABR47871.1 metallophosphoesterase [Alkaliphilus metalliredigens QYMF]